MKIFNLMLILFATSYLFSSCSDSNANELKNEKLETLEAASKGSVIQLPKIKLDGISLLESLEKVRETKKISAKEIDLQLISELLWGAHGITYKGGNKTIHGTDAISGATLNKNERYTIPVGWYHKYIRLYYLSKEGGYEYNIEDHSLIQLTDDNLINKIQAISPKASAIFCLAVDKEKFSDPDIWAYLTMGMALQNIHLVAASHNLVAATQGMFKKESLVEGLHLANYIEPSVIVSIGFAE
ncbi:MAG: nitroreductase family protein [Marinifilaceae bacterium]|jgi:nitroreductase|nr:nitroreductase family protein [Marinifilaceae bacterium]